MGKIYKDLFNFHNSADLRFGFLKNFLRKFFPVVSSTILGLLIVFFVLRVIYTRPDFIASLIADDIKIISLALEKIDSDCNILKIKHDRDYIDFLTVREFEKSSVGPLNLVYPQRWEGPYLNTNPTMQEKLYEIIKTKDGIYIVPGNGVKLPNGLVVGKDFEISTETKIANLLKKGGPLNYKGYEFAIKIDFKIGDWDNWWSKKDKKKKKFDYMLKEFNSSMPLPFS